MWYWHNAMAIKGILKHGTAPDWEVAIERLRWMARSVVDINGIGCPGEELNGGDYAMAIGCLGALAILEGLLGFEAKLSGLTTQPRWPGGIDRLRLRHVFYRGRFEDFEWGRENRGFASTRAL